MNLHRLRRIGGAGPIVVLALLAGGCTGADPTAPAPSAGTSVEAAPAAFEAGPASLAVAAARPEAEPTTVDPWEPGRVVGTVWDLGSGAAIAGAEITADGRSAVTDAEGTFVLALPLGAHDLRFTAPGRSGATYVGAVAGLQPTRIDVALPPEAADPERRSAVAVRQDAVVATTAAATAIAVTAASGGPGPASLGDGSRESGEPVHIAAVVEVPESVRVLMPDGEIVEMAMEEYLRGVVPAEMGYLFRRDMDALKAQAIAARTYAATSCLPDSAGDPARCEPGIDANVDTTTRTQVWRPLTYDITDEAVTFTRGQVARHEGALIHALYFARTRERTLSSEDSACCGGRSWSYLRSVSSPDAFAERRGHGAGMSQEGAAVLGDWGATAEEIARYYYTGVTVDPVAPEPSPSATPPPRGQGTAVEVDAVRAGRVDVSSAEMSVARTDGGPDGMLVASSAIEAEFPFMAVGVRWVGEPALAREIAIEARTSHDGVAWRAWQGLLADDDLERAEPAGEVWTQLWIARGSYVQVRVGGPAVEGPASLLERVTVYYLNADAGPAAPDRAAQAIEVPVISRAAWGADERLRFDGTGAEIWPPEYTAPRAQIVHHTVTGNDPADPAAVVRSIYHYHAVSRGWGDIGYNYVVDHRGNVYEGRRGGERGDRIVQGGHAREYNANTIGVALLGTFTSAGSRPSAASETGLVRLLAAKGVAFGIAPHAAVTLAGSRFPSSILGHRDVLPGHTACPGDGLHARLPAIRDAVAWLMAQQQVTATPTRRPPTATVRPPTATLRPATATNRPPTATVRPATATARPAPLPTATVPPHCAQWVRDGGFEAGAAGWILSRASVTRWDVYRGEQALFVGLRDDEPDVGTAYSSAMQAVRVTGPIGRAWLTFFARSEGEAGDRRLVRLLDQDGAIIALGDVTLPARSSWNAYRFDVTQALAGSVGKDVRLYLGVINDGNERRSYVRFDEVSLVSCPPGVGTASVTATAPPTATFVTPRASAAPSRTASTRTPDSGGDVCAPVLRDGDFASGAADRWRFSGSPPGEVAEGPAGRQLSLGPIGAALDRFGYSAAARTLRLPDGVVTATVTLRLQSVVLSPEDAFVVEARRTVDGARVRLIGTEALPAPGAWHERRATWDARTMGRDVELFVAVLNRGQDGPGGPTVVLVDDVAVDACARASADARAARYLPWGGTAGP